MTSVFDTEMSTTTVAFKNPAMYGLPVARYSLRDTIAVTARIRITGNSQMLKIPPKPGIRLPVTANVVYYATTRMIGPSEFARARIAVLTHSRPAIVTRLNALIAIEFATK